MAENKQYITRAQKDGAILISEDVIGTIVAHALKDVDGVVGLNSRLTPEIADFIGAGNWAKGVRIKVDENGDVCIDCNIIVSYGSCIVTVAKAAQEAIANSVEAFSGVKTSAVNVNVCGVVRK